MNIKSSRVDIDSHKFSPRYLRCGEVIHNDTYKYEVHCLLTPDYNSFDYIETPIFISCDGKNVYKHEELRGLNTIAVLDKVEELSGFRKLVLLGYTKEEKEIFLEKYFEVLI